MDDAHLYFEVIEETFSREIVDALRDYFPRIDEVWLDLTWQLSRNPRIGMQLYDEPGHRICITEQLGETPSFWVIYRPDFENHRIHLVSIQPIRTEDEP